MTPQSCIFKIMQVACIWCHHCLFDALVRQQEMLDPMPSYQDIHTLLPQLSRELATGRLRLLSMV